MAFQRPESEFLPSISRSGLVGSSANFAPTRLQDEVDLSSRRSLPAYASSARDDPHNTVYQMQEQVVLLKGEVEKRDQLVLQLSSMNERDVSARSVLRSSTLTETEVKSENAGLKVKIESLSAELRETLATLQVKDSTIAELRNEVEAQKQDAARSSAMVTSFRQRISDVETHTGDMERVHSRSEFAIQAMQKEAREYQDKIIDLEQRLRTQLTGREEAEADAKSYELRHLDLSTRLGNALGTGDAATDALVGRVADMTAEITRLRTKVETLNEALKNSDMEGKASRETIMRLAAEANRNEAAVNQTLSEANLIRGERSELVNAKTNLEKEVEVLHQRLAASQNAMHAARQEVEHHEARLAVVSSDFKRVQVSHESSDATLDGLRQHLATMLSDEYLKVEKRDEAIKARIRELMDISREKSGHIEELDEKLKEVVKQLDGQVEASQGNAGRARKAEMEAKDLKDALSRYEEDIATRDAIHDGFRREREKFYEFQDQLLAALNLEQVSKDVGFDSVTDAIVARIGTLTKVELDRTASQTSATYNLQRKVKTMKEQLDSKDLHLDLLRKKISELEERNKGKTDLEKEKDANVMRTRKLQKQVEKQQISLGEARQTITELKCQLLENSNLKIKVLEKSKGVEELEKKCTDLDMIRGKQAKKIASLRHELGCTETELGENKELAQSSVTSLGAELKTTRNALDEISKRERELLDLRQVVARMLGLDISTLAVPDYEIISRLEKLVQAHHSYAITNKSLENALEDLEDGFRAGYEDARLLLGSRGRSRSFAPPAPPAPRASSPAALSASKPASLRARSASPKSATQPHNTDPRVY